MPLIPPCHRLSDIRFTESKVTSDPDPDPYQDPDSGSGSGSMITDTDPRIRIRIQIKMIWIRNTASILSQNICEFDVRI